MGVHGLQLSGLLPATQAPIPTIDFFAVYATWESFIPQVILLGLAIVVAIINTQKDKKNRVDNKGDSKHAI
jgi:high-affinity iron transporter